MAFAAAQLLRTVSFPHLRRHKLRTSLTLIGIAAGVATMVATGMITDSVFSSFATTIGAVMGGADFRVSALGLGLSENVVDELRTFKEVRDVGPVVDGYVSLPKRGQLAIVGIDVLVDPRSAEKIRSGVINIPDQIAFVTNADSVIIPESLATGVGLAIGSSFSVGCPRGTCTLVVRGIMPDGGMAAFFGGKIAIMDLLAAQSLLDESGRIDNVDVWLTAGGDHDLAAHRIGSALDGRAWIEGTDAAEQRAKQLLMAIRVFLTMAAFVAVTVGFFIVYHTVAASVHQRRQHFAVLNAVGISKRMLLRWLLLESVMLAVIAITIGLMLGTAAARLALTLFGTVTSAWVPTSQPRAVLTVQTAALATGFSLLTVVAATMVVCASILRSSTAQQLSSVQMLLQRPNSTHAPLLASLACFAVAAVLVSIAPATLPYQWLVTYILTILFFTLLAFGLLAPIVVHCVATTALHAAGRRSGISLLLAASNLRRNPGSFIVVVTAIVGALASTLASFSLTASLRYSALTWLAEHYRADLVLTGEGAFSQTLTSPPIASEIAEDVRKQPGVKAVQGVRVSEIRQRGLPAVLLAYDHASQGFMLYDADWEKVATRFWNGAGVLISDNLARMREITKGQQIELPSSEGIRNYEVLGTFPDYTGGSQLGSIAIARDHYRLVWKDDRVNRINIWVKTGQDAARVAHELTDRYLERHGLRALTLGEIREQIGTFIDDAFSVMYALVAVSLFVSFVGVVNFLATVLADRNLELSALRGIGVSSRQNLAAAVAEGSLVGIVGAMTGVVAGFTISMIITFHSVPMVTGWMFLFVFPPVPAIVLAGGAIVLSAAAALPSALGALRKPGSFQESAL